MIQGLVVGGMSASQHAMRQIQPIAEQRFDQGIVTDHPPEAVEQNAGASE